MSNKVNYVEPSGTFDFNNIEQGYGFYQLTQSRITTWLNLPPDLTNLAGKASGTLYYGVGSNSVWEHQLLTSQHGSIYIRFARDAGGKVWGEWTPLATTTPPIVRALPLASGMAANGSAVYSKSQDGRVLVYGSIIKASGMFVAGETLFTFPLGFTPSGILELSVDVYSATAGATRGGVFINSSGGATPGRAVMGQLGKGHDTNSNRLFFDFMFDAK